MSSLKTAIAVAAIASLSANVYLGKRAYEKDGRPECATFRTDEQVVYRTSGGLLEVTTIRSPELFEVSQDHTVLGIPVGKTVSRIRVPAVFRYHIELAPEWKILLRGNTFIVVAPAVKPSLPVAIDTANIAQESSGIWSAFTGSAQRDLLKRSITGALAIKAASPSYIRFQREVARVTVKEFVAKWLITQERWKDASKYPIQVYFADEPIQTLGNAPPPFVGSM